METTQKVLDNLERSGVMRRYYIGRAAGASCLRSLNIDEPLVRQSSSNEFYHTDALGSVLALTGQSGTAQTTYSYEAFGKTTITGTSSNPFQYTGRENDGTGLYYHRARYYSPSVERFISEDPKQFFGGVNFYIYAAVNPVMNIDPFGLQTWPGSGTPADPRAEYGAYRCCPQPHDHNGLDIPNAVGAAVKSSEDGYVVSVQAKPCNGQGCNGPTNQVFIMNDGGTISGYAHVTSSVKVGDRVKQAQPIGTTDLSGISKGGHVHYTYRPPGQGPVNPRLQLPPQNNYNNSSTPGSASGGGSGSIGGRK